MSRDQVSRRRRLSTSSGSVAESPAGAALADFRGRYHHRWRLERHDYRAPAEVRAAFMALATAA
ncbi:MAG: hypothetical protein GX178_10280 [Acidobacteria bacterium]|nr:hypothetical protein [Thermoanaerobaculia bacterium]MDI9630955.1 hypothetical protein [Acidobacteriota bacterium]MBP7812083.1 hypothetical protein [Thermoanaerobaculia bacterium]MBP8845118.1 hypothetical protein [Thermoanaerobaculia bacterium]NLN11979.1 hypothetical protein [Acidobacteriota bacterium]